MQKVDTEEHVVLSVLLLIITICCLGFSFWAMTKGYETLVGSMMWSAVLSFILVMMLFALNYRLRRGLMQGISGGQITLILAFYLLVVFASFSGLFNQFYSTFMRNELLGVELTQKTASLRKLEATATAVLTNSEAEKIRETVKALLRELKAQISSPSEPGWGTKAEAKMQEIEKILGREKNRFTRIPPKSKSSADLQKSAEDVVKLVEENMDASDSIAKIHAPEKRAFSGKVPELINPIIKELQARQSKLTASESSTEGNQAQARADAVESIQKAVTLYSQVAEKVASLHNGFEFEKDVKVENAQLGKISHTYYSAQRHLNHWAVWIAAFLALAIDLIVPCFVFALTPRGHVPAGFRGQSAGAKVLPKDF